ncbi:MAG: zinc dependent phospholipase C family protein [Oscillospiraceae bacterium]
MRFYNPFVPLIAQAWFKNTHVFLCEQALELLKSDGFPQAYRFYEPNAASLYRGATDPDVLGDPDSGAGIHYYCARRNPAGGRFRPKKPTAGYYKNRFGSFAKSAGTMLEENYTAALSFFKSGKPERGAYFAGRAAHFLCDAGCTAHSAGIGYAAKATNPHFAYERYAEEHFEPFAGRVRGIGAACTVQEDSCSPLPMANALAEASSCFGADVLSRDPARFARVLEAGLPAAVRATARMLLKLYRASVRAESTDCVPDGVEFVLFGARNSCALSLDADGDVVCATRQNRAEAMRLTAHLRADGSYTLESELAALSADFFGRLTAGGHPARFRFTARGAGIFRLSLSPRFKRVLQDYPVPHFVRFQPENDGQNWKLGRI